MIFGKINPVASVAVQNGPFATTTITGSYMAAIARPYVLGADKVDFQVTYGEVTLNESGSVVNYNSVFNTSIVLSGSVISSWGTDDVAMLSIIADEVGTTVERVVSGSLNNF
jgi:hypothetical protein